VGPAEAGYIEGCIALARRRARRRLRAVIGYLALFVVILLATGAVRLIPQFPVLDPQSPALSARRSTTLTVDLAHCPALDDRSLPIVSFIVVLAPDGTPERYRCFGWQKREPFQPRPREKKL
jgi:hypothetical protein